MKSNILFSAALIGLAFVSPSPALTLDPQRVDEFIRFMVSQHGFDESALRATFATAKGYERILEIMERPAETKPWYEYRAIFMTPERISAGVEFWQVHEAALGSAAERYGVPVEIILAIMGVETFYGRTTGSYPVLESVATLAFHYPKRGQFFRQELEQLLLLAREERVDPMSLLGSYAGAMGMPQFIASSFRHYAVDFDGDGKRNIWSDIDDVVGSIAHYLSEHGWQRGGDIALSVAQQGGNLDALMATGTNPRVTVAELVRSGVVVNGKVDPATTASLIALEQPQQRDYWLGFQNFDAITKYNRSVLYAMVVFQLSEELRVRRSDARL